MELEKVSAWYPKETYLNVFFFIWNNAPLWSSEGILNSIDVIEPTTPRQYHINVEFEWVLLGTAKDL